jgi:hypothetical protein
LHSLAVMNGLGILTAVISLSCCNVFLFCIGAVATGSSHSKWMEYALMEPQSSLGRLARLERDRSCDGP